MRALIIITNVGSVNVSPTAINWSFSLFFPESVGSVHRVNPVTPQSRDIFITGPTAEKSEDL